MVASAIIEKRRREMIVQENTRISALWLVPQFFLVGAGEAFAYVGQLEFFIREAPERMKSMSTGLFLSNLAMGYFVSSFLVTLVVAITKKSWIKHFGEFLLDACTAGSDKFLCFSCFCNETSVQGPPI